MPSQKTRSVAWSALTVLLSVSTVSAQNAPAPTTRTYYMAAEEVEWDYAPSGIDEVTGEPPVGLAEMILTSAPDRIGRVYKKALYREYTDSTFTKRKERSPEWQHLGYLGPLIRGVVGDTIRVVFRNNASRPYSVHPHGVFYDKASEGALYADGTSGAAKADDGVPPGGTHVYTWPVPERAGPGPADGSSIMWMYHSHVNEPADVNAGLMGVMVVTRRDMARQDGSPKDVDREFVIAFAEFDENLSWYFEDNINSYAGDPDLVVRSLNFADLEYLIHLRETINGFSYSTLPGLSMQGGRWYDGMSLAPRTSRCMHHTGTDRRHW